MIYSILKKKHEIIYIYNFTKSYNFGYQKTVTV